MTPSQPITLHHISTSQMPLLQLHHQQIPDEHDSYFVYHFPIFVISPPMFHTPFPILSSFHLFAMRLLACDTLSICYPSVYSSRRSASAPYSLAPMCLS